MYFNSGNYEHFIKETDNVNQSQLEKSNSFTYEDKLLLSILQKLQSQWLEELNQIIDLANKQELRMAKQSYKNIEQIEGSDSNSDTLSLSFANDEDQQLRLFEQQQWQSVLSKYGNFFQAFPRNLVKMNDYLNYLLCKHRITFQDKYNNILYLAYYQEKQQWVVVKEQKILYLSIIDAAQQFLIQDYIYKLYPQKFLKLFVPIYIQMEKDQDTLKFISLSEQGTIDLYQYSQQKLIKGLEFQLIIQQLFQQIYLLHSHKIAHRDIKPQNVIFVENKGWLLCDFENSCKYTQMLGVYDIKGTYSFLLPQLQKKSKIQGLEMKQNLIQNDLYALGITLLVIKYQIKTSEQIDYHLRSTQDPIIHQLLQSLSMDDLSQHILNYEMKFIKPQLQYNVESSCPQIKCASESFELIQYLGQFNQIQQMTEQDKTILIDKIDEQLNSRDHFNYFQIICYIYIPDYIKNLKNIEKYKSLRQSKYWKKIIKQLSLIKNYVHIYNQIYFMYQIGLTDLVLFYAYQYIEIKYDFIIHIIIIYILRRFSNYEEAKNQLNHLITHREFYQMNEYEQRIFLELNQYQVEFSPEMRKYETEYLSQMGVKLHYFNPIDIDLLFSKDSDDIFYNKLILSIKNINNQQGFLWYRKINMYEILIESIFHVKSPEISLRALQILQQQIKYQCPTVFWQDLLKQQVIINELLKYNNKKLLKKMNYVQLFNSENKFQQQLLKNFRFSALLQCKAKKKQFKTKIIKKIQLQIKNLFSSSNKFSRFVSMNDLLYLISDSYYTFGICNLFQIIAIIVKYHYQQYIKDKDTDRDDFFQLTLKCFKGTKNIKRVLKLVPKTNLEAKIKNLVKHNKREMLIYQFHLNQYLTQ